MKKTIDLRGLPVDVQTVARDIDGARARGETVSVRGLGPRMKRAVYTQARELETKRVKREEKRMAKLPSGVEAMRSSGIGEQQIEEALLK
jgi:hypothetical protein